MERIVSFGDLYSFKGDYDYSLLIYNTTTKDLLHYSKIADLCVDGGDNYCDKRESFTHCVVTLSKGDEHLFPIRTSSNFDLATFNLVGSVHQQVKYFIPDDSPTNEIEEAIRKIVPTGWTEAKNGLGNKLGYIYPLSSIETVSASDFYVDKNPLDEQFPEAFQVILDHKPQEKISNDHGEGCECDGCSFPF